MNNSEPINEELLSAYLDGELSEVESLRVEKQLEQDDALRSTLSELEKIRDEIRQLPRHKLSNDFASKITQSIQNQTPESPAPQPTPREPTTNTRRIAGTLAAIAALLLISVLGIRNLQQPLNVARVESPANQVNDKAGAMPSSSAEPIQSLALDQQEDTTNLAMDSPVPVAETFGNATLSAQARTQDKYDLVVDYELDAQNIDLVSTSLKAWKKPLTRQLLRQPSKADASISEYVIEGTPEEIRTALVSLRSPPTKQLASTQQGRDYQNQFFGLENAKGELMKSNIQTEGIALSDAVFDAPERDDVELLRQARTKSAPRAFPVPSRDMQAGSAAPVQETLDSAESKDESESEPDFKFGSKKSDVEDAEEAEADQDVDDAAPVRMRVLVRIRNK